MDADLTGVFFIGDDGQLEYAGGDLQDGEITVKVYHFSKYAVLEMNKLFTDVTDAHGTTKAIQSLAAKQIVYGKSATAFGPSDAVTRAEFAAMLVRALGLKPEGAGAYADVASGAWYSGAVAAATEAGIVQGKSPGAFAPEILLTREEMAVMLVRAYHVMKNVKPGSAEAQGLEFKDSASISPWAKDAVSQAAALALLKAGGDNLFQPAASVQRAEGAQAIYHFLAI